ncbi:hypothetical protein BN159_7647 [Streptomyces davaonensis JCM 4913]|uniref:Relaxase/mobilization nuclease n=1 Tax=Streptomyces davaonensis (strain DSM 101723 / JCM 4913 / KCC S-0913 / 768) TaxID=1214101 RepID=K4R6X1_STRDJ|nr:hypothetical protein [Streptomyces davaonensis]CCK32026.1 hypothetical protein BN159_7647 [Streptomyces davaonensis JCM 4913]
MIIRIGPRELSAGEPLAEALGRPVSDQEGLTDHTVVAHWDNLDLYSPLDEGQSWTAAEFAEHLNDPHWHHPAPVSPHGDRPAIWHAAVRLHPDDRELTGPEWSEIAHRIARVAGIQRPGDDHGCRWIAVQAQPGRLDLIANLIRPDDTWTAQPHRLHALLSAESRRIEAELGLISPRTGPEPQQAFQQAQFAGRTRQAGTADTTSQLAGLLRQLADERTGPLATVRGLIEHAAHRLEGLPDAYGPNNAYQLEMVARRLYGIQQSLESMAAALPATARPSPVRPTQPPTPVLTTGPTGTRLAR